MKRKFFYLDKNLHKVEVIGNAHKIRLENGEIINVYTHKVKDGDLGEYWCVADVESGLQIAGFTERASFIDYFGYKNTEKKLLEIAKKKIEWCVKKTTWNKCRETRLAELKNKFGEVKQ